MECLFCKIINREIPADIIYEDDAVLALLDVFPCTEGHTLVIPKRHMPNLLEMREDELLPFWRSARHVLGMLRDKLGYSSGEGDGLSPETVRGFTIGINHDKVAGQAVEHLHLHLIPRYEGDRGGSLHSVVKQEHQRSVSDIMRILMNQ